MTKATLLTDKPIGLFTLHQGEEVWLDPPQVENGITYYWATCPRLPGAEFLLTAADVILS